MSEKQGQDFVAMLQAQHDGPEFVSVVHRGYGPQAVIRYKGREDMFWCLDDILERISNDAKYRCATPGAFFLARNALLDAGVQPSPDRLRQRRVVEEPELVSYDQSPPRFRPGGTDRV